ncbi:uncharacterized protein LOC125663545 [Ostrea edulis]|uniref:uncharacterized protein LOC125663545 n=1 Tax=Ostrea edulis TaxID=37623 RepID=UPI0024AEE91F|nr:uncharacterized protein LOC125663545 [Ostrea edulis]
MDVMFCDCPNSSAFPVFPVDVCPENETEVIEASGKLNCSFGYDETKNEYHCVPFSNFTQLVEFCYPKTSGLIGRGLCMVLSRNTLDAHECHRFQDGCPNILYTSETMYQFPACSRINKESKCYLADPACPPLRQSSSTTIHNTTTDRNIPANTDIKIRNIMIGIFIPLGLLFLSGFVYFKFRRRGRRNKNDSAEEKEKHGEEQRTLLEEKRKESGDEKEELVELIEEKESEDSAEEKEKHSEERKTLLEEKRKESGGIYTNQKRPNTPIYGFQLTDAADSASDMPLKRNPTVCHTESHFYVYINQHYISIQFLRLGELVTKSKQAIVQVIQRSDAHFEAKEGKLSSVSLDHSTLNESDYVCHPPIDRLHINIKWKSIAREEIERLSPHEGMLTNELA